MNRIRLLRRRFCKAQRHHRLLRRSVAVVVYRDCSGCFVAEVADHYIMYTQIGPGGKGPVSLPSGRLPGPTTRRASYSINAADRLSVRAIRGQVSKDDAKVTKLSRSVSGHVTEHDGNVTILSRRIAGKVK